MHNLQIFRNMRIQFTLKMRDIYSANFVSETGPLFFAKKKMRLRKVIVRHGRERDAVALYNSRSNFLVT